MKRFAMAAAILLLSAGCRAPMPTWDCIGPYGTTRVPPPPTGGYGVQQPYYAPGPTTGPTTTTPTTIAPTTAPVGTGFRPSSSNRWSNIDDPAVGPIAQNNWSPTRPAQTSSEVVDLTNADVILASHETAAPFVPATQVVEYDGPIRILPPNASPASTVSTAATTPHLRGMTLNDATRSVEPQPFVASGRVIDISQLPDAPNPVRTASSTSSLSTGQSSSSGQATVIEGGWKTRT
ncbi:MAG: hypothetical protein H6822_14205 [Planctomycetaceae bacterium]|nr:hypothetical protein [Planctomycetales bacterium]MCB9923331.1 hypothetical protein [Planctomycetaceae bacterium]